MLGIILPIRNAVNHLRATLESVSNQTYLKDKPYKIVVVDNGSTDGICQDVCKPAKYISCCMVGVGPALNTGLFYLMGFEDVDFIARIDAGDIWHPTKLDKQMEFFANNPEHSICGTAMNFVSGSSKRKVAYPEADSDCRRYLLSGHNPIAHPSVVFKKDILSFTGCYDESYKGAEDMDLWGKCMGRFKMGNLLEALVDYDFENKDRSIGDNNAAKIGRKLRDMYVS